MATRQEELQGMVDTVSNAMKAVTVALQPIMGELGKIPKLEAQVAQLPAWQHKCEELKRHITQQDESLKAAEQQIKQLLSQTKEGRLAALKAQQERLAQVIAAEEEAPKQEEQPNGSTGPQVSEEPATPAPVQE